MLSETVVVILSLCFKHVHVNCPFFGIFIRKQIAAFYSIMWYERNTGYLINTYETDQAESRLCIYFISSTFVSLYYYYMFFLSAEILLK